MAIINFKKLAIIATLGLSTLDQTVAGPAHSDVTHISGISGKELQEMNNPAPAIFVCGKARWKGNCTYVLVDPNTYHRCLGIQTRDGYTSFGPDKGIIVTLYADNRCQTLAKMNIIYPGSHDLISEGVNGTHSGYFTVKVNSYDGVYRTNTTGGI